MAGAGRGRGATSVVLPARFLTTVGHLVIVILALYALDANVAAGLDASASADDVAAARSSTLAALVLALGGLALELAGLLSGATAFAHVLGVVHTVAHFAGGVLLAWYVVDVWGSPSVWPLVVVFNLIPAALEAAALLCGRRGR